MRNLWFFLLVGLSTEFISEKLFVSSETSPYMVDDLYIEGLTSGSSPVDDEDGDDEDGSGSGSGDGFPSLNDEEEQPRRVNLSDTSLLRNILPLPPGPGTDSPQNPPTTAGSQQDPALSKESGEAALPSDRHEDDEIQGVDRADDRSSPSVTTETNNLLPELKVVEEKAVTSRAGNGNFADGGRHGRIHEVNSAEEVYSENLWERTDVLAAVIACGVVGFLCAVSLLLLLAYRMKKKDEGSYDLGDTKLSATAYHKAPTKEFYA